MLCTNCGGPHRASKCPLNEKSGQVGSFEEPSFWDEPEPYDVRVDGLVRQMFGTYRGALEFFHGLRGQSFGEAAIIDRHGREQVLMYGRPITVRKADESASC